MLMYSKFCRLLRRTNRALLLLAIFSTPVVAQQDVENVAAFAQLYGVARWFYPSDAAATLDWNRFAVEGVRRVRTASTPEMLEATLKELFVPLGPGIQIGTSLPASAEVGPRDPTLIAWHYRGAALSNAPGAYTAKRMNRVRPVVNAPATPTVLSQEVAADSLRGKSVRLRAQVRVADPTAQGSAGLWLRVDRTGQNRGFFDNMQDRPVRDTLWREYIIEGPVASDATRIIFGALKIGAMSVDVDAVELSVREPGGDWTPLTIIDASFEAPSTSAPAWGQSPSSAFSRVSSSAADGAQFLRMASPVAPTQSTLPATPTDSFETPRVGEFVSLELTRGLQARVPLSLTDAEARAESPELASLRAALEKIGSLTALRIDTNVRLADVVVAWNVLRHFYPYWDDVDVDWNARLRPHLAAEHDVADNRSARRDALRRLVADIRDGHGSVSDVAIRSELAPLPLQFRVLSERLVVIGSRDSSVPVGSVVTAIDGEPASTRIAKETQHASGTLQWRQSRAASALAICQLDSTVVLAIESPTGETRVANVRCNPNTTRTAEPRPDSIAELQPGIWYVDITRVRGAQLRPMLETLSNARGVIFDVRGYPTDAGAALLPHLMREPEAPSDRWMHIPRMSRPFGEVAAWQHESWNVQPSAPHIGAQRVFLTDGRAISYAESVMGYVRDHTLGTIIGGTTAGANGNIADFVVPGGFSIVFTGMRVTRHDGVTPFHMIGVTPDISLEPTLAGIRAGRDELIERAVEVVKDSRR